MILHWKNTLKIFKKIKLCYENEQETLKSSLPSVNLKDIK